MQMEELVKPWERVDDLQRDGLVIIQNPKWFSFGIDAVLLASYAKVKAGGRVMDLGTGTGIVPLLLSSKTQASEIVGIELQPEVADMARRSLALNGELLGGRVQVENMDIRHVSSHFEKGSFDVVTSNPPYFKLQGGLKNETDYKTLSRHEVAMTLDDLFACAYHVLRPQGSFYMVHRPDRLVDIVASARAHRLEPKTLQLIQPKAGAKPNLMLMRFVKYGGHELKFENPLVVYTDSGDYTPEVFEMYRVAHLTSFESHGEKNKENQ